MGLGYQSVEAYLAGLPAGLASHPRCMAKGSLLRDALRLRPIAPPQGSLPEPILALIEQPPAVNAWVHEVAFNAAVLAIYDEAFGGRDLDGFEDWVCDFNRDLFRRPVYRVLFALVSPSRLVALSASRWSAFHRGTSLLILERSEESARLRVEFPRGLFVRPMLRAISGGVRAAVTVAGATEVVSELETIAETSAEYSLRWNS